MPPGKHDNVSRIVLPEAACVFDNGSSAERAWTAP